VSRRKEAVPASSERQQSCKARIEKELRATLAALRAIWKATQQGREEGDPTHGTLGEYGLCFSFVAPGTFRDQKEPYFRYQLSWGGPSDEFRFYASREGRGWTPYRIEYWFMDWFDGAKRVIRGENLKLMEDVFSWFDGAGLTDAEYRKAMED
jgi:hypothetical protein